MLNYQRYLREKKEIELEEKDLEEARKQKSDAEIAYRKKSSETRAAARDARLAASPTSSIPPVASPATSPALPLASPAPPEDSKFKKFAKGTGKVFSRTGAGIVSGTRKAFGSSGGSITVISGPPFIQGKSFQLPATVGQHTIGSGAAEINLGDELAAPIKNIDIVEKEIPPPKGSAPDAAPTKVPVYSFEGRELKSGDTFKIGAATLKFSASSSAGRGLSAATGAVGGLFKKNLPDTADQSAAMSAKKFDDATRNLRIPNNSKIKDIINSIVNVYGVKIP